MAIQVSTEQYQFAHGKAPRGEGQWAFSFEEHIIFTPWAPNYTSAVAHAKRIVRRDYRVQDGTISVCP